MKVDGSVFASARRRVRAAFPGRGEPGRPAPGTQEWVADEARVSLRAVQYLEKGNASLRTIKAVSQLLGIARWEDSIRDYGQEYVTCTAKKLVDFRPELYPPHHADTYGDSTLLMSLDPLSIQVDAGKFPEVVLNNVTAALSGLAVSLEFVWLAEVLLTPAGKGWLGWVREIDELCIPADGENRHIPLMFRQLNSPQTSWRQFIELVEATESSQLELMVDLEFANFNKQVKIYLSTDLLHRLFAEGRQKHQASWPYRVQVRTIT